jgi:uncharacterized membrane protein YphA (DoxX/SURF4 family)
LTAPIPDALNEEIPMTSKQLQRFSAVVSLMFVVPACLKLSNAGIAVEHFATWGIPTWMMHVIGASELAGAIGLLLPRTRLAAAFALFLLMIGGLFTHLTYGEYLFALMPLVWGGALVVVMKQSLPDALTTFASISGARARA